MPTDEKNQPDSPDQGASGDSSPLDATVTRRPRASDTPTPRESAANIPAGLIQQRKVGQGRFTLIRELGRGGMGVVWLAHDQRLEQDVALKLLPPEVAADQDALKALRRETQKSQLLSHPHIIRIHDLHETPDEPPFILMELVTGSNLRNLLARQPDRCFSWDYLRPMVGQLCDALEYAHRKKVVHRDLKPANLMLGADGELKLADFGIAATLSDSASSVSKQRNQDTSGTLIYMSPQQMDGRQPRPADDIYSFGATLYELLTGNPPFYTGGQAAIIHQAHNVPPTPLNERLIERSVANDIPPIVSKVVMDCLAKERDARPQSAAEVWRRLAAASSGTSQIAGSAILEMSPESAAVILSDDWEPLAPGRKLNAGRLTLIRLLGHGAVGAVWLARDEQYGTEVALKMLPEELIAEEKSWSELRLEIAKSRGLVHNRIMRIHDLHTVAGEPAFISSEYLQANSLESLRAKQPQQCLPWTDLQPMAGQLCDALEYAHGRSVLHRDLKPGNLMLDSRGNLKVADFCISATIRDLMLRLPGYRDQSGAIAHLSPQQMDGRAPTVADDIYALGAALYTLLTGKPPFVWKDDQWIGLGGDTKPSPLAKVMAEAGIENQIPANVDATILACLSRESADRPQSAAEVWHRLTGEKPPAASLPKPLEPAMLPGAPTAPSDKPQRTLRRFEVVALIIAVVLLCGWWIGKNKISRVEPEIAPMQPTPAINTPAPITKNLAAAPAPTNTTVPAKPVHTKGWETNATTSELQTAATAGEVEAMTELGNRSYSATNYAEAAKWYQKGCDATNVDAEVALGRMYLKGRGVDKNSAEALKRFQIAADQKNAGAEAEIGSMYQRGDGVGKDYAEAQRWFRKAAEQGDATGEARLGSMYRFGLGVNKDNAEALKWFHQAADRGGAEGETDLGDTYLYGLELGLGENDIEACKWYRKAADQGYSRAQHSLGSMYQNGSGVDKNYTEALKWYRLAAERGDSAAANDIGAMYQTGQGVERDYVVALNWYRQAADGGNAEAENNVGWIYQSGLGVAKDYAEALNWYRKAADHDFVGADINLGWLYQNGLGTDKNYVEALKWYRKAAAEGNISAENNIGWMYQNGWGVDKDYSEAVRWYRKAADRGYASGENNLGWMYQNGWGVERDYTEALKWYRKAAAQGNTEAENNIGAMYASGWGVTKDYAEAVKWLRKSAEAGNMNGQFLLASMYERGFGVDKDPEQAIQWYRKSAAQGNASAKDALKRLGN